MDRIAKLERTRCLFQQVEPGVETFGHGEKTRSGNNCTADEITSFQPGQIEGDSLSGTGHLSFFSVDLHFTNSDCLTRRHDFDGIANLDAAGEEGAGDHRAEATDGKVTVDR